MSAEDNKQIVRTVEELWAASKLDELDQYFVPGYSPPTAIPQLPPGLEGAKSAHQSAMQTFPDRNVEIVDMVAEGDKVVVRCRVTGTNRGGSSALGAPANDAKVAFEWISIYELKDGKITNHWGINDGLTLLQQLGVMPPPGAQPPEAAQQEARRG